METAILPKNYRSKSQLAEKITTRTAVYRRPIHKLAMLLAANEVPERPEAAMEGVDQTGDQTEGQLEDQTGEPDVDITIKGPFMARDDVWSSSPKES